MALEIRLLSPVEAIVDGRAVALGGPKQRALLAMLALRPNETVPVGVLVEGLWGDDPPPTASKMLQGYVSRLRKLLPGAIVTHGRGYELRVPAGVIDAERFERLVEQAAGGDANGGAGAALALWRGPPLVDVADEPFAAAEIRRLEALRSQAQELAVEAELAAGRHAELVPRLAELVAANPLRERLHALRMRALYRAGRQADALEAFHDARRALAELGLEPGAELRELQAAILRQDPRLEPARPQDRAVVCPFKGLASFEADDARFFFGREALVTEMIARLAGGRPLAVVGPSGSGKSSAVRAGLLPALAAGGLPGSERWPSVVVRPGAHPLAELRRVPPGDVVVLVVDQFEETFAACRDEAERERFLDALSALADDRRRRVVTVIAIRADFYERCAAHPGLARLVSENQLLIGPPGRETLRRAIEGPAERAQLEAEPRLVAALLRDLERGPGALPLLSTALLELWRERDGNRLTLAAYERTGGVRGAVARLAESAYAGLSPEQQPLARDLVLRLVDEDERGVPVRRRVPRGELGDAAVLGVLADRRLVTVDDDGAELVHEALLTEWPRLAAWLDDDAEQRRARRHLALAGREWAAGGRDPADLYRGTRLAAALELPPGALNAIEREFVAAGREQAERETAAGRRTNRRLRALLAGAAVMLVVAIAAGVVALGQRGDARASALAAQAGRLGAGALLDRQLDQSLLLAKAANDLADSPDTRGSLLGALLRSPAALAVIHGTGDRIQDLALSPDGRTLALPDNRGVVLLVDPLTHRVKGRLRAPEAAAPISFSADGRTLALATDDPARHGAGEVQLADVATQRVRLTLRGIPPDPVMSFAVSGDGSRVVAASGGEPDLPGPTTARAWRTGRGTAPEHTAVVFHAAPANGVDYTPDGRRVLVGALTGGVAVLDARTLAVVRRVATPDHFVERLSPDGRTLALGGVDGTVSLLDVASGKVRRAGRHDAIVQTLAFSPDGRTLISAGDDAKVIVWDVATASEREVWSGHAGRVLGSAFTSDGRTVYTAGLDGTAIAWDVAGGRRLGRPFRTGPGIGQGVETVLVSPRGDTLAVAHDAGSVSLIDTATLREQRRLQLPRGVDVHFPAFSPDGRLIGISGDRDGHGYVGLFDAESGRPAGTIPQGDGANTPGLGRRLIVTGSSETAQLWSRGTLRKVGPPVDTRRDGMGDVSISPDDRFVAIAYANGTVEVRSAPSMKLVERLRAGRAFVSTARFSPDAKLLVAGDDDGKAYVWSTATWRRVTPVLSGQAGGFLQASFGPRDRVLATSNTDGTVALWDLASGRQIGTPLPGEPNRAVGVSFTPDGHWLFAAYPNGVAYRWDMRLQSWRAKACSVAGRDLTRAEWAQFGPARPYAPVCG